MKWWVEKKHIYWSEILIGGLNYNALPVWSQKLDGERERNWKDCFEFVQFSNLEHCRIKTCAADRSKLNLKTDNFDLFGFVLFSELVCLFFWWFSRTFKKWICLFALAKWVKNADFLIKHWLFICIFSICSPK